MPFYASGTEVATVPGVDVVDGATKGEGGRCRTNLASIVLILGVWGMLL